LALIGRKNTKLRWKETFKVKNISKFYNPKEIPSHLQAISHLIKSINQSTKIIRKAHKPQECGQITAMATNINYHINKIIKIKN
jgi:hypothetical protein